MNISKQAIEAGAKACWENSPGYEWKNLNEIAKESERSDFAAGLTAAIPHIRGEGKQADCTQESKTEESVTKPQEIPVSVTTPNPDDVERVARAMYEQSYDRPPTIKWHELGMTKKAWLDMATAAIRAMKGQVWGIWNDTHKCWYSGNFNSTDKNAVEMLCASIRLNGHTGPKGQAVVFEVRPYTAPREESAEKLANDFVRAIENRVHLEESSSSFLWEQAVKLIREAEKRWEKRGFDSNA